MAKRKQHHQAAPPTPDNAKRRNLRRIHERHEDTPSNPGNNPKSSSNNCTRICIKQLPQTLAESTRLKNHLFQSQQSFFSHIPLVITDCKVLPKRRMAFVGCSTADAAEACVKYLHRSYCRSTRLVVEFATPPPPRKEPSKSENEKEKKNDVEQNPTKRTTTTNRPNKETTENNAAQQKDMDAKKQEYLAVMGASSEKKTSSRVWSNDDDGLRGDLPDKLKKQQHGSSDDSSSSESDSEDDKDDADPLGSSSSVKNHASSANSDLDFLRSKTVSVQDLDEDKTNDAAPPPKTMREESYPQQGGDEAEEVDDDNALEDESNEEKETNKVDAETATAPNRLFVRNIAFDTSEEELRDHFAEFGDVQECHIPIDDQHRGKGFGFVSFDNANDASSARQALDGTDFQGRLIHILPARRAPSSSTDIGGEAAGLSYKERQELERRGASMKDKRGWSASHVRSDAVVDNLATRLGLRKGDILSVKDSMSGGDAAVRLALAETAIIEENRKYFADHGIDMESLVSFSSSKGVELKQERSKTSILVKNLPYDTTTEELMKTFSSQGSTPSRVLLPPSRTVAVIDFVHAHDAKRGFKRLAYRRFKSVPLYLEWAPTASLQQQTNTKMNKDAAAGTEPVENEMEEVDTSTEPITGPSSTVYVKNLNFKTTEEELQLVFEKCTRDIRSVRIPKKLAPLRKPDSTASDDRQPLLSMGYAFVEFGSQESALLAVTKLQGTMLAGHSLELQISRGSNYSSSNASPSAKSSSRPPSKIMVRNVPFQASRKELLQLFGSFGQLKKARLPKKFDGNHRGFAFIEFVSGKEAAAAMKALSRTHLYGRHLVLEWAETEEESVQGLREKVQKDEGRSKKQTSNTRIRFE